MLVLGGTESTQCCEIKNVIKDKSLITNHCSWHFTDSIESHSDYKIPQGCSFLLQGFQPTWSFNFNSNFIGIAVLTVNTVKKQLYRNIKIQYKYDKVSHFNLPFIEMSRNASLLNQWINYPGYCFVLSS